MLCFSLAALTLAPTLTLRTTVQFTTATVAGSTSPRVLTFARPLALRITVPVATATELAGSTSPRVWKRRTQRINYEYHAGTDARAPPVLLLPGFGAGAFHYGRNLREIAAQTGSAVFAMDYLGQGGSWPDGAGAGGDAGIGYSIDFWIEQVDATKTLPARGSCLAQPRSRCNRLLKGNTTKSHPRKPALL